MTTLFLYFSNSGNGDIVADFFRERGAEVRKVTPKKPLPKSFFASIMRGGFLATIGHKAKLTDWNKNLEGFDRIVIGSPVWNGRFSCPINTVLASLDLSDKALSFVLYSGGGTAPKAEKRIAKDYPNASVIVLKDPKKFPQETGKLKELFE